jgi:hypothetical protein
MALFKKRTPPQLPPPTLASAAPATKEDIAALRIEVALLNSGVKALLFREFIAVILLIVLLLDVASRY